LGCVEAPATVADGVQLDLARHGGDARGYELARVGGI
jgi:hypothetical protein